MNVKHLGIIMDGNRRFSKKLLKEPWKGHELGARKLEQVLDWAKEFGIEELTLFAFSLENFNRPKKEYDFLMELFLKEFERFRDDKRLDDVKIRFIGRLSLFPDNVREAARKLEEKTKNNTSYIVNFAFGYGGRAEIVDAVKTIMSKGYCKDDITEELISQHLYLQSEPDMIIRTSGEKRMSGFLLWQGSYSEYYFSPKLWPEFEREDFVEAIEDYAARKRRYGR